MVESVCLYQFLSLRNLDANIGVWKKGSIFRLICGVAAAVRVVKYHSDFIPIVFLLWKLHFAPTPFKFLCTPKVLTELKYCIFTVLRTVLFFVIIFRSPKLFSFNWNFHCWKLFFYLSVMVSGNFHGKLWDWIGANFKKNAAIPFYSLRAP